VEEEARQAKLADEEYARRVEEDLLDEKMIQQAIAMSLREIDHTPLREVMLSSKLNI
jgi:hypothetical protein